MANTYTQIHLQFVFAVQNRTSLIGREWKDELYKYVTGIVQTNKHKLLAINGASDHVHAFIGYQPHQLIPELLQDIKGGSSKWINERGFVMGKFQWQEGYGAFSYSHSQIDAVVRYIVNQEEHHKRKRFDEEYQEILREFKVQFDARYVLRGVE